MYEITKVLKEVPMAHRLPGHEGRCKYLHGHNYLPILTVSSKKLDNLGRVIDFSLLKGIFDGYDHATFLWVKDPLLKILRSPPLQPSQSANQDLNGVVAQRIIAGNIPTVENVADVWLRECITSLFHLDARVRVVSLKVFETSTSSATAYNEEVS